MFVESLALKQGLGNANSLAVSLTNLGLVERDAGRPEDAAGAFEEAIAIWERTGDRQRVAVGLHNAALLDLDLHRHDEAAALARAARYDIARELGDRTEMAYALADTARVEVERGALDEAAADARRRRCPRAVAAGRADHRPAGARGGGQPRGGARRRRSSRSGCGPPRRRSAPARGFANMPADERHLDEHMAAVRERLDPGTFADAWAEGPTLGQAEATDHARSSLGGQVAAPTGVIARGCNRAAAAERCRTDDRHLRQGRATPMRPIPARPILVGALILAALLVLPARASPCAATPTTPRTPLPEIRLALRARRPEPAVARSPEPGHRLPLGGARRRRRSRVPRCGGPLTAAPASWSWPRSPTRALRRYADFSIRTGHTYRYLVTGVGADGTRVGEEQRSTGSASARPAEVLRFNCVVVIDERPSAAAVPLVRRDRASGRRALRPVPVRRRRPARGDLPGRRGRPPVVPRHGRASPARRSATRSSRVNASGTGRRRSAAPTGSRSRTDARAARSHRSPGRHRHTGDGGRR